MSLYLLDELVVMNENAVKSHHMAFSITLNAASTSYISTEVKVTLSWKYYKSSYLRVQ